jgi:signal transduction histidine kinase
VYLSIFFAAYALTSRLPVRRWWPYTIGVIPIAVATTSQRSAGSLAGNVAWFMWFVAVAFGAAAVGAAVRTRAENRSEQARRTATEEQLRMAHDLHDGVGHGLAVIAMQAGVALHVLDRDPAKARESLLAIRDTSRESLESLRAELSRLSTDPGGGPRTVRNGLADLPGLVSRVRAGGLEVDLRSTEAQVPEEVGAVAYLVVQEALTNVLRHSAATSARVEVASETGSVVVSVTDDGQGGEVSEGLGLGSMRSRVERLGGSVEVGPTPRGFEVRAVIPWGEP